MGLSTTYTKTETDFLIQQLEIKTSSGYQGDLLKTDAAPTTKGFYALLETGIYPNLGNINAEAGKLNFASFDGTTWSKIEVEIPSLILSTSLNPTSTDKAETGKSVAEFFEQYAVVNKSEVLPYTLREGQIGTNGYVDNSTNWLSAKIDGIAGGETITIKGYGMTSVLGTGEKARVALYNSTTQNSTTYIAPQLSNLNGQTEMSFVVPAGAVSMSVQIDSGTNVGTNLSTSPFLQTFKVYKGNYQEPKLRADKISGNIITPQIQEIEAETFTNRLFDGEGAPSSVLGNNGDKYFDKISLRIYTKYGGSWGNGYFLGGEGDFTYPADFTFQPFELSRQSNKIYVPKDFTNIRDEFVQSYIDTLTPYYVDPVGGSNTNNGLSRETPFKWLKYAVSNGARLIYIKGTDGFISRDGQLISTVDITTNEPLIIIGEGSVIFAGSNKANTYTWTANSGCWSTTRASVSNVMDFDNLDANGNPTELIEVFSLAECQSTSNTYYINGSTLYVHPLNNSAPTSKIEILLNVVPSYTPSQNVPFVYFENVGFATNSIYGAIQIKNDSTTQFNTKAYFYNCYGFKNKLGNIFSIDNIKECWVQNCRAYKPKNDGFNYHTSKAGYEVMKVVEINNYAEEMGKDFPSEPSSNGSTIHEGGTILRLNCTYINGRGGNVADVNAGVRSLNLNVKSTGNYATNGGSFIVTETGSKMWLYDCVGNQDLATQYSVTASSGANLYYKNSEFNQQLIGAVTPL